MNGIWYYAIAFVLIWVVAIVFKNKLEKHGVEIEFPVLMWKTRRLRGFIDKIANISPRFWKWFMNIGLVICVFFMIFMAYSLVMSLSTIMETPNVSILLPGVEMPGSPIFIPFLFGFIGLITVIVVHEFSHGILARAEKVNIKSIGLLLFTILPGAFVEPDEDEMKKAKKSSKLRIFAAGSMANLTLAFIAFIIFFAIGNLAIPGAFEENGVEIQTVLDDAPASGILKKGMVIKSINNQDIHDSENYLNVLSNLKPNEEATIVTDQGTFEIKLGTNPNNESRGYLGIQGEKHFELKDKSFGEIPWVLFELLELFKWIFFLNFAVGTFNLLPMKPLDGGHILENLLRYKLPEKIVTPLVNYVSICFGIIIVFSIVYSFGMGIF
ncbi:site-2 protease family protein [Methanobrevibacter sp. DSM 116169]|uniref:site-2 protease family protein n=1 Tax=Methanobrevibacter sp. DSM 116169 TaxID=3242727 RepID=UPI0038FC3635